MQDLKLKLGRIYIPVQRDAKYPLAKALAAAPQKSQANSKYWWAPRLVGRSGRQTAVFFG